MKCALRLSSRSRSCMDFHPLATFLMTFDDLKSRSLTLHNGRLLEISRFTPCGTVLSFAFQPLDSVIQ